MVEDGAPEGQYALPLAAPWPAEPEGARLEPVAIPESAWLAAELGRGASEKARAGILRALPDGSALVGLGDLRRGVPESVDLVIAYDFSESRLQPSERAAISAFARRGGAVFFVYASRAIPAASVPLWRELFGAGGGAEIRAPGLPQGLLMPRDFRLRFKADMPRLVWQRCGRGIVLAYELEPEGHALETAAGSERLFRRAVESAARERRPVALGPVEPDVYELFAPPRWSRGPRVRFALLASGYALAAMGLLASAGGPLSRRGWTWLAGAVCLAAGGAAAIGALSESASGLSLDTAGVLILEREADPVAVVLGRVARLGPGEAPELGSAARMPPKVTVYRRYSAFRKSHVTYRFRPGGGTVQPHLAQGQSQCLISIRVLPRAATERLAARPTVPAPAGGERWIALFRERWADRDAGPEAYRFRWVRAPGELRLFDRSADEAWVQVRRGPVLVVERRPPRPAVSLDTTEAGRYHWRDSGGAFGGADMPNVKQGELNASGKTFALVVSRFNEFITSKLLDGAVDCLTRHGASDGDIDVYWVPGSFEIPSVARRLARRGGHDAVICLGAVIRGQTPHFDYVAAQVAKGVAQVAMEAELPTTFGVLTTDTIEQAIERAGTKAGNKGADAALAAIELADLIGKM
jgi:6,7-dimethyl-8-ribityllumazine synthase